jgi:hypothetical protein
VAKRGKKVLNCSILKALCLAKIPFALIGERNHLTSARMIALVVFLLFLAGLLFEPKVLLEEETAAF